ncbi:MULTISPECIES: DUF397 domain-containing protein [Streptomyces]|uniref:DUF397 domain-containing protein n=1 Tax=Streptomyces thermoviolaceus subsp. thermoviolaceus TaxID=66860 RepID=A0ABX0YV25_STRTL|nr:DUF397 domain-containing protein [Streptomyces thermoviolaceus]NJP14933.1 DUF397 domain-containing protein [Streptomyces thermoviolaceus subsp. thermoviolaceus]GGV78184.1 DUF397 domain-containing protein [Streptomyces thermoviolaceus subsp. apingens]GHB01530.1 DUF397 domain-containing protein [Streptomyces thermoviolaceus subsp. thermoviolaceus]
MSVKRSPEPKWIKSSYSSDDGPSCVEIAMVAEGVLIRDSKNPTGPRLTLTPTVWAAFLAHAADH